MSYFLNNIPGFKHIYEYINDTVKRCIQIKQILQDDPLLGSKEPYTLTGPVSLNIFEFKKKRVYIFGDIHFSLENGCSEYTEFKKFKNYEFSQFLHKKFTTINKQFDFYLEITRLDTNYKKFNKDKPNSYINLALNKFINCWEYDKKNKSYIQQCSKQYKNTRFHYTDFRTVHLLSIGYILDDLVSCGKECVWDNTYINYIIFSTLLMGLKTSNDIFSFMKVFISNDFFGELKKLKLTDLPQTFSPNYETELFNTKNKKYVHRIGKQFMKIKPVYKSIILDKTQNILKDTRKYIKQKDFVQIKKYLLNIFEHILSIYTDKNKTTKYLKTLQNDKTYIKNIKKLLDIFNQQLYYITLDWYITARMLYFLDSSFHN
jgi:hypothetical protein